MIAEATEDTARSYDSNRATMGLSQTSAGQSMRSARLLPQL
jgi:hypothetical protein